MENLDKPDWPWQIQGVADAKSALADKLGPVVVTSPTGMGKGRQLEKMAGDVIVAGGKVILFTNRRILTRQTGNRFAEAGLDFGYISRRAWPLWQRKKHDNCVSANRAVAREAGGNGFAARRLALD